MKRILILTNNMNGGGAERVLLTLLQNLPRNRYMVDLCLVYWEGALLDELPDDIHVTALFQERNAWTAEIIRQDSGALYLKAAKQKYDVEIAFLEGNAVKILSRSPNKDALKIAWVHVDLSQEHYTSSIFESVNQEYISFSSFDRILCVSKAVRDGLEKLLGSDLHSKTVIVYNPIDQVRVQRLAREKQIAKQNVTFCAAGRLTEQKGFDRLLNVAGRLYAEGFHFKIWILGEGYLYDKLQYVCRTLHISENIIFWGFQKNPYPYISSGRFHKQLPCRGLAHGYR